jgi:hypothetical protein
MNCIYFETGDSRREHSSAGITFVFTKWGMVCGSPQGVYKAKNTQEMAALAVLASDPKSNIWEIDQTTYERRLGIKETTEPISWQTFDSGSKKDSSVVPPAAERIKPTFDRSSIPAVPVEEAPPAVQVKPLDNVQDALKTGKTEVVVSPPPVQASKKSKSKFNIAE